MEVHLAYGDTGLDVDMPDGSTVVRPRQVRALTDERAAIRNALRKPIGTAGLRDLVSTGRTVSIVHSDITRPMPNDRVLPVLLRELEDAGVARGDVTLINALGTHRRQTPEELSRLLGADIVRDYRCIQHDAWDNENLVPVGTTSFGNPVRINRFYLEADVKVLTGFIEPHFFAGFSGGPKAVLPSVAGVESVISNHGEQMISSPGATWGVTGDGNPVWREMMEVALMTRPTFLLNVTLNAERRITGVFAGDLQEAHRAGREFCRSFSMVPVPQLYDIVVTTNSGYPLDQNLYQCVKGMSAAFRVVKPGGAIILAAECRDGLPDHGEYANLLRRARSPGQLLDLIRSPGFASHDQWQVQIQAMIQEQAEVHVFADGLSDRQIRDAHFVPCRDIASRVRELARRAGPGASVCVLPDGPQTLPVVEARRPAP